jgi:Mrp family chromosome partitioning ATPase
MIVEKAINMAQMMHIPVFAVVENMSYITCPDCGKEIHVFGESHIDKIAEKHGVKNIARLPIAPTLAAACDDGRIESFDGSWLDGVLKKLVSENK